MLRHLLNYIPGKLLPGIISFLSIYIFARIFTQEEYGNYSFVFAQLTLISAVLFSWIRLSAFRFFNIYNTQRYLFIKYLLIVYSVVFVFFLAIIIVYIQVLNFNRDISILFILGIIMVLFTVSYDQIVSILRADLNSKMFAYYEIIKPTLKVALILVLVLVFNLNETAVMYALIISHLILISHFILDNFKRSSSFSMRKFRTTKFTKKDYLAINKEFLYYGLPLTFSFLFANITSTSDRIIIKYLLDAESVAKYTLAYDLTSFTITNVFMILNFTFIPVIIKLVDSDRISLLKQKILDYLNLLLLVVTPVVIFLVLFAQQLTEYILGDQYNSQDTVQIIQLISISTFLAGIKAYFFDFSFQFGKKTKNQIYPIMIGGIINIILNFIFIPKFGIVGAVYATGISYSIALIISILLGQKIFKMYIDYKTSFQIILGYCTITFIFVLIRFNQNSFGIFILNVSIYLILILFILFLFRKKLIKILKG
ncbi:lipopolysaccharide biosynthesis protein [Cytobacillus kochii]